MDLKMLYLATERMYYTQSCHKFCYNFHVVQSWRQWGRRVI